MSNNPIVGKKCSIATWVSSKNFGETGAWGAFGPAVYTVVDTGLHGPSGQFQILVMNDKTGELTTHGSGQVKIKI